MPNDLWFEQLAETAGQLTAERAPAKLQSRTYSAIVAQMAESGPLLDLTETRNSGGHLCIFETTLTVLPRGTSVSAMNPCRICHARILGERMEQAPIFWPGCPYAEFHHG